MGKPPSSTLAMVYFLIRERQYKFHIHTSENLCVWGKMEHVHFKNRFIDCNKFLYFTRARRKTRKQAHPLENPLNHPTNTLGQLSLPRAEVFIHIYIYIFRRLTGLPSSSPSMQMNNQVSCGHENN